MRFKAMNQAKMKMALDRRDFLEQFGSMSFDLAPH